MRRLRLLTFVAPLLAALACHDATAPRSSTGAQIRADVFSPLALTATAGTSVKAAVSGNIDTVSGSVVRSGTRGYFFGIANKSATTVTNATVTIATGWGLSSFPGIHALPIVGGPVTLAPDQSLDNIFFGSLCCTLVPSSFALGFDSERSVTPTRISTDGATQTASVTLKLTDIALWTAGFYGFSVGFLPTFSGVTLISTSLPSNLDEGETIVPGGGPPTSLVSWSLHGPRLNKEYTFTVTLHVPNPFGVAIDSKPPIHISGTPFASSSPNGPSTSVFVAAPSLDGLSPGSGGVTFAVDQAMMWDVVTNESRELMYNGLLQRAPTSAQSISFTSAAPSPAYVGATYAVTATATSGLLVTFSTSTPGICSVSGGTVTFIAVGTCTVAADQKGDGTHLAAPEQTQSISVVQRPQTIAFSSTAPNQPLVGSTYAVTATASSGLVVSFTSLTPGTCTVAGSTATFVAAGPCTIAADQAGNATYLAAPEQTQSITIITPAQAVLNLTSTIASMGLPAGVANSLSAPLNNINTNNLTAACGKLDAFVNQVNAKVQNGQLTMAAASQLLQAANAIKASLGC